MKGLQKKKRKKRKISHSGPAVCWIWLVFQMAGSHGAHNKAENTRKRSPIWLEAVERSRSICILIASEELSSHTGWFFLQTVLLPVPTWTEQPPRWALTSPEAEPSQRFDKPYDPIRGREKLRVCLAERHSCKCLITAAESPAREWDARVPAQLKMTISQFSDAFDDQAYQWAQRGRAAPM